MGARALPLIAATLALALLWAGPAAAQPGPPLRTPEAALEGAVRCVGPDLRGAARRPVLLVHGTFVDASFWDPTYARALPAAGHPTCTVDVPDGELGDVQRSVEYVVAAIREVNDRAGRPIAVIGHSQGAFLPTLALRLWPDLARRVEDFVGLAGVYGNGTQAAELACGVACAASAHQLAPGSRLLTAYARRPLYDGPSYSTIATDFDELVVPQPSAGTLEGVRRIAVQDLCPGRPVEHGGIIADAVAYALVRDALDHEGPANAARVGPAGCARPFVPGTDLGGLTVQLAKILPVFPGLVTRPAPDPPLICALDPACAKPRLRPIVHAATTPRRDPRRPYVLSTAGTVEQPPNAQEPCGGRVTVEVERGQRRLSRRSVAVGRDCTFSSRTTIGRSARAARRARGRLRVTARFGGTPELSPTGARAQRVVTR